jgi:hypothetical protein
MVFGHGMRSCPGRTYEVVLFLLATCITSSDLRRGAGPEDHPPGARWIRHCRGRTAALLATNEACCCCPGRYEASISVRGGESGNAVLSTKWQNGGTVVAVAILIYYLLYLLLPTTTYY